VILKNEPIFSLQDCGRLMLIKLSESVQMATVNLLPGEKAIYAKQQGTTHSTWGKTEGTTVSKDMALTLTS
jgi:hypothetical protein